MTQPTTSTTTNPLKIIVIGDETSIATEITKRNMCCSDDNSTTILFEYLNPQDISRFNYNAFPKTVLSSAAIIYTFHLNSCVHWKEHAEFIVESLELSECMNIPVLIIGTKNPPRLNSKCVTRCEISPIEVIEYIHQVNGANVSFIETDYGFESNVEVNTSEEQYLLQETLEAIRYSRSVRSRSC